MNKEMSFRIDIVAFVAFAPHERFYGLDPCVKGRLHERAFVVAADEVIESVTAWLDNASTREIRVQRIERKGE